MSKLKISPNLFLETAELNRMIQFLRSDGYEQIIKSMVKTFGVVVNSSNSYYKVTAKPGSNAIIVNSGVAFDSQLRAIISNNPIEINVTNTGIKKWVVLEYASTNWENGTASVTSNGSMQGVNTTFSSLLRGQPNFPTKVKFNSELNTEEYEVVSVLNDTAVVLAGSFIPEQNIQYGVVGAFTPGFQPSVDDRMIYELDSYKISIVDSEDVPPLTADQYILASISFVIAGFVISDMRSNYMFNQSSFIAVPTDMLNEIVSLLKVQRIENNLLELSLEHGYKVDTFELIESTTATNFRIKTGACNFLGTGDIPNNLFKDWILVNNDNFKTAVIIDNIGKDLFLSSFSGSIAESVSNGFSIVPPFTEIQYRISYLWETPNSITPLPYYFTVKQGLPKNKVILPIPFGEMNLILNYRMIDGEDSTPWLTFSISPYVDVNGETKIISGDSSILINTENPIVELRNYS